MVTGPGVHEGDQGQAGGAGDQGDLGPPEHGLPGDGIPHPAGAVVGEEAHRVQGLLGGAGGHRHPHPLEGLGPGQLPGDVIQEDLRLGHLSAAHRLAGQQAAVRRDDLKAVALQGLQVVLGDGVFQHGGVHGWGHQLLALGRQDHGGEHIVGNAVGQLGDDIRRGRGNEDQVRCRGQRDVMDVVGKIPVKSVHHAAVVGEGLEGQGGDELRGIPGHHHVDLRPRLPQGRGHVGDFCRRQCRQRRTAVHFPCRCSMVCSSPISSMPAGLLFPTAWGGGLLRASPEAGRVFHSWLPGSPGFPRPQKNHRRVVALLISWGHLGVGHEDDLCPPH